MKILMVSPHLPGLTTKQAGERLVFDLIEALARDHEVHLVTRSDVGEPASLEVLERHCRSVHLVPYRRPGRGLLGTPSIVASYFRLCRAADAIARREAFDVVHVQHTETGLFWRVRGHSVIEAHDVLAKPMERRYRQASGLRRAFYRGLFQATRLMERYVYGKFDSVFVLSQNDRDYLLAANPALDVVVLRHPPTLRPSARHFQPDERTLLFLGAMDRGPNVDAVRYFHASILPLVRRSIPDVRFVIAGSRPAPEVRALASEDGSTVVTGFVEDIEATYRSSTVMVAPLRIGGGIIVKILDALAAGLPVVTTSIGNEGIAATPGEHLLVGDDAETFAARVVELLEDGELRRRLGGAAQAWVAASYSGEDLRRTVLGRYSPRG